jgi:hypothetical protein
MFFKPRILLHLEGAAVFALSLYFYRATGAHWGLFLLLFLWPDLFMLGYLISVRVGSVLYNLVHTYVFPLALLGFAIFTHKPQFLPFALIWISHISFDRALGYGLKYPTFFKDTHLQRVS